MDSAQNVSLWLLESQHLSSIFSEYTYQMDTIPQVSRGLQVGPWDSLGARARPRCLSVNVVGAVCGGAITFHAVLHDVAEVGIVALAPEIEGVAAAGVLDDGDLDAVSVARCAGESVTLFHVHACRQKRAYRVSGKKQVRRGPRGQR